MAGNRQRQSAYEIFSSGCRL